MTLRLIKQNRTKQNKNKQRLEEDRKSQRVAGLDSTLRNHVFSPMRENWILEDMDCLQKQWFLSKNPLLYFKGHYCTSFLLINLIILSLLTTSFKYYCGIRYYWFSTISLCTQQCSSASSLVLFWPLIHISNPLLLQYNLYKFTCILTSHSKWKPSSLNHPFTSPFIHVFHLNMWHWVEPIQILHHIQATSIFLKSNTKPIKFLRG